MSPVPTSANDRTVQTTVTPGPSAGTWTVTFRSEAIPGTLSAFAGTLTALRLDIISACVTRAGDVVTDAFDIAPLAGVDFGPQRCDEVAVMATQVLAGTRDLAGDLTRLRDAAGPIASVAPVVELRTDSEVTTGIHVSCADRPGLLYDITRTLTRRGLRTRSLSVLTFSGIAKDAFRVVDDAGQPLDDPVQMEALRRELLHVCGG